MGHLKGLISVLLMAVVSVLSPSLLSANEVQTIEVRGLFKGAAVMDINGRQRLMKVGELSSEGVRLLSADSKAAVVEYGGKRRTLSLSQGIGTSYAEPDQTVVRLISQHGGHYYGTAKINGQGVQFLLDTGASSVSMSSNTADKLGLKYKNGQVIRVSTAQGITRGFNVKLRRVEVGPIRVSNVSAIVLEGEYPLDVLLGNSFLSKVDMYVEDGVLVLQSKI